MTEFKIWIVQWEKQTDPWLQMDEAVILKASFWRSAAAVVVSPCEVFAWSDSIGFYCWVTRARKQWEGEVSYAP